MKDENGVLWEVKFHKGAFCLFHKDGISTGFEVLGNDVEVVGNIYEGMKVSG